MNISASTNPWVVIAAYNEEEMIGSVVRSVMPFVQNIVVVDDCSRDATSERARDAGAHVIRHILNQGQGAALQTGMRYALLYGADAIIHFDADGQHDPHDIPIFLETLTQCDIVLGSRFLKHASHVPRMRSLVLRVGILFTRIFSGLALTDTHNGFRALSRKAASAIVIRENRMTHASEIIHEIARQHLTWKELPTLIRYTEYSKSHGQSSLNSMRIAYRLARRYLFS